MKKYVAIILSTTCAINTAAGFEKLSVSIPCGVAYDWFIHKGLQYVKSLGSLLGGSVNTVTGKLPSHTTFDSYLTEKVSIPKDSNYIKESLKNFAATAAYLPYELPVISYSPTADACTRVVLCSVSSSIIDKLPIPNHQDATAGKILKSIAYASAALRHAYLTHLNGELIAGMARPYTQKLLTCHHQEERVDTF